MTSLSQIDLRELAELEGPERAFLSVYVSGEAGLGQLENRLARLETLLEDEPEELEHFRENLKLVRSWFDAQPTTSLSLCVFACYALDFVRGWSLPVSVRNFVRVGVAPYLRPLAELQDDYEPFVLVAADNESARIYSISAEEAEALRRIRGDVKNSVKKGGWSQMRYARRREKQLQSYAKEVAGYLQERATEDQELSRIVLLGSQEATLAIEAELPANIREMLVAREDAHLQDGEEQLVAQAVELESTAERRSEEDSWREIRDEYMAGGLAALGATECLSAVLVGQVDTLLINRGAEIHGVRCRECENVVHGSPNRCQVCGAASVVPLDLVSELVRQAQLTGADVDFADRIDGLAKAGDVAALLRY